MIWEIKKTNRSWVRLDFCSKILIFLWGGNTFTFITSFIHPKNPARKELFPDKQAENEWC